MRLTEERRFEAGVKKKDVLISTGLAIDCESPGVSRIPVVVSLVGPPSRRHLSTAVHPITTPIPFDEPPSRRHLSTAVLVEDDTISYDLPYFPPGPLGVPSVPSLDLFPLTSGQTSQRPCEELPV